MIESLEGRNRSKIDALLEAADMPESERRHAIAVLHSAEQMVDLVVWIGRMLEDIGNYLFHKPQVKHQE